EPDTGDSEPGNLRGQKSHHETARSQIVQRIDFSLDIGACVPVGSAAIVKAAGEVEHRVVWIDSGNRFQFGVVHEVFDLVLHTEGKERAGGIAMSRVVPGSRSADGEVESLACAARVAIVRKRNPEALREIDHGGWAIRIHIACPGVGVAVAKNIQHRIRMRVHGGRGRNLRYKTPGAEKKDG